MYRTENDLSVRSIRKTSVAVVGGAGFLGSHLVQHLIEERECKVVVIDNLLSGRKEFVHPLSVFEHLDITTSERRLLDIFRHYSIQYVFNYAACPYIPVSFSRPSHVFMTNSVGALNVINAAQEAACTGILQVSSAEIYGNPPGFVSTLRINEDVPPVPHSSYGVSKLAIDHLVQVRWREARTPCISLRQFNCVGERETHPYVIPEIIGQLYRSDNSCVHLGNNSVRDFLYAGDAVKMAVELLEYGSFGQVYNLGSENAISIYELAEKIGRIMELGRVTIHLDNSRVRPWEIWHLQSDNKKIYDTITARPEVSLDGAIRRTINHFEQIGRKWVWE